MILVTASAPIFNIQHGPEGPGTYTGTLRVSLHYVMRSPNLATPKDSPSIRLD